MEHTIYTQIPLTFTVRNILEKLHIPLDMENEFTELANKAKQIQPLHKNLQDLSKMLWYYPEMI